MPTLLKSSGLRRGSSITSRSSRICSDRPGRGIVDLQENLPMGIVKKRQEGGGHAASPPPPHS